MTETQSKQDKKYTKWKVAKFIALRSLIIIAAIAVIILVFTKLIPWIYNMGSIWTILSFVLGFVALVGIIGAVIFAYKSIKEARDRWKLAKGEVPKELGHDIPRTVIPMPPPKPEEEEEEEEEQNIFPEEEPTTATPPPAPPPLTTSELEPLSKTTDFNKLRELNILERIMEYYRIGVPRDAEGNLIEGTILDNEGNIIEGSGNNLFQDFQELNNILSLTSDLGIFTNNERIQILTTETIFRVSKLLNPNLLFVSTIQGEGDNKFLNLEQSKNLIGEKILTKETFEGFFWLRQRSLTHYVYIKGEINNDQYIVNVDDSITRSKDGEDNYILSRFSKSLEEAIAETLITSVATINYVHSRKQLFGVECGQHSLDRALEEYFLDIGCIASDYDNDWLNLPAQSKLSQKNYGNYNQYIHQRTIAIFILERQSGIEEFFKTSFLDLLYTDDLGNNIGVLDRLIERFYRNIRVTTQEIQRLFMVTNRDLNLNPDSNPNDIEKFQNNLAKYDAQIFQIYAEAIKEIMPKFNYPNSVRDLLLNFVTPITRDIKKAIPELLQTHGPLETRKSSVVDPT